MSYETEIFMSNIKLDNIIRMNTVLPVVVNVCKHECNEDGSPLKIYMKTEVN